MCKWIFVDGFANHLYSGGSGPFTSTENRRYTIEKDGTGHSGYGGQKVWKLFLDGRRAASLDEFGRIISD